MTDHDALNAEDFDELLDIEMDINPKNITLDLDYDSEPVLTVSFVTKVLFRSITDRKAAKALGEDENPLDPEHFDKCHRIPVPTIQYLNNRQPIEVGDASIKKLQGDQNEHEKKKFAKLMEKAYNHDASNQKNVEGKSKQSDTEPKPPLQDDFLLEKFQASHLYTFKAPVRKWATAAKDFPIDLHRIRFSFGLTPIYAYTDNDKKSYEVMIPNRKSKGGARPAKGNFYPKIRVKKFPPNADTLINETILEFDIHPNSVKLFETHPRQPGTKKISFVISFLMVRHVLGPALNTLAPIYVIAFLTPFTCFFDLEGTFDEIAGYLVTLLLALVAHRIVITEAQTAIQKFTMSDFDFAVCTLIIVIQMIVFVIISSMPIVSNGDGQDKSRMDGIAEQMETLFGLDLQRGPAQILFWVEESIIVLWILFRFLLIAKAFNRLVHENEFDLLETTEELTVAEYRQLRADRKTLARDLKKNVYLKSLFSTNLKILFRNALERNDSNEQRLATKLPTNDIYRCRCYQNGKNSNANSILARIKDDNKFELVYTDTIPKRPKNPNEPKVDGTKTEMTQTDVPEGSAAKAVYSYSPAKGKKLLLEVQFLKDEDTFNGKSHKKYKVEKIIEGLEALQKNASTRLKKSDIIMMYLQSLFVEVFSVYKHNFWSKCASDRELLSLMLRLVGETETETNTNNSKEYPEKENKQEAAQEIKNLLQTGKFETSNHDADIDVQNASESREKRQS